MHRRSFVRTVGAAAITAPFLKTLDAKAQDPVAPKRFIFMLTGNGFQPNGIESSGSGATFTLGSSLRPLDPFKAKLNVLRGLDNDASYDGPGAGHQKGVGAWLTGRPLNEGDFTGGGGQSAGWASGISVDQRIAQVVGGETRFPSLELGVQVEGSNNRHRISYAGNDAPLPPEDDPRDLYRRVFASVTGDAATLERLRRRRQSVLDWVNGDLGRLRGRLGAGDRPQLDAHLENIREIERRLEMTTAACTAPGEPAGFDPYNINNYQRAGRLTIDLMVSAMQCDMTRVSTLLWGGGTSSKRFPDLGFAESHHTLSHDGDTNTTSQNKLRMINQWYATQLAYLLGKLDSVPEGSGTMLDNTVVIWGSELSKGNTHSRRDMPVVMAGSLGGYLRTGRFVQFTGQPHNNLLLTILHGFGIMDSSFGAAAHSTGTLSQLVA